EYSDPLAASLSHLLLQRPLLLILCLLDLPPLPRTLSLSLSLSLSLWVIVWVETGVLESEQIPTSCNMFHNQDLYKYSVLPLPHCQIVNSAQSVYGSSRLLLFRSCFPCLTLLSSPLQFCPLRLWSLSPVLRLVILLLCPGFPTLLLPWIPLQTCSPVSTPLAPASASSPGFQQFPLTCTPSSPCVSINTLVTSSQSPRLSLLLGSPVPLRVTVQSGRVEMNPADTATLHQTLVRQGALLEQHDQALKTLLEHIKEFSQSLSDLQDRPFAQSSQPVPSPSPPALGAVCFRLPSVTMATSELAEPFWYNVH
ncbi:unnamed protein product, partial [Coregonus sp. 'balchen']